MWELDVGCAVVIDAERKPVGMVTDRDIAMAAYTRGVLLCEARVASAMANEVRVCAADTSLADLEHLMQSAQIRRVPVIDSKGELCGIVALGDIARSSQSSPLRMTEVPGVAKTLARVTERRHARSSAAAE
jgi:CBS domain-containing protein